MKNSKINIPFSTNLFIEVHNSLKERGSDKDTSEAIEEMVMNWLTSNEEEKEDIVPDLFEAGKGYSWKELFLPHGTSLRMKYRGNYSYAKVKGDHIYFESISVSPSEFANSVAQSNRNAWRDLEIMRPKENKWYSAFLLRKQEEQDLDKLRKIDLSDIAELLNK